MPEYVASQKFDLMSMLTQNGSISSQYIPVHIQFHVPCSSVKTAKLLFLYKIAISV